MKERITLTLNQEIVSSIDKSIDGYKLKNRSHAIELLLQKALGLNVPNKAVILAGGKGARLRPLTYEIPKALIPVQGKALTEHLLDLFRRYEIREIFLAVGHMNDKIKSHFGDGSKFGVHIHYIEEDESLGTAGTVRLGRSSLDETFIVSNADELKDIDIPSMYRLHKENSALITIALTTASDPSQYGVARLNGSRIMEFVEKPMAREAQSNLINSGFYIMEPQVISMIGKGFAMFEKDIFPKVAELGKLYGFPFSGQWLDTRDMAHYEKAINEWRGLK